MERSGEELREARETAGLTQERVAEAMGLHRVTIVGWEARARIPVRKAERYLRVVRELASGEESKDAA